ncbi:MAG: GTP-binding protein [Prevotellaceae bacterium]|nr:GTP-binding protein [Candidatus Minthosoma caballi]
MKIKELPVLLLTGYLGSGKTTLLNRILTNKQGIKFAVIVNDIGEVNIDADLVEKGGIVGQKDESLVALQNGCICCTLKMDLVEQLRDITKMHKFDYIVIEASGICEPAPIAQTICSIPGMGVEFVKDGMARLDCIVTVVDALRLKDEFAGGLDLLKKDIDEEDIENLVIQQIEFCNMVLLNKASEVTREELGRIKEIIRALQPKAEIIECDYCDVDLEKLVDTRLFDFEKVATSATWVREVEDIHDDEDEEHEHHHHDDDEEEEHEHHHHHEDDDDDEHEEHHHHHNHHDHDNPEHGEEGHVCDEHCCHHHHHHHHHDGGEVEEYGIGTFVYFARKPFSLGLFDEFVARKWPKSIIRAKGLCYFDDEQEACYVFEQAGKQVNLRNAGQWYATMPSDELKQLLEQNPKIAAEWDPVYGDRMQKLVFIGQKMDKAAIKAELDACLVG